MSTGKTYSTKYLLDSNNNRGAEGQVLSTTSTGIDWVDANTVPGTGLWLANGNDIYNSNSGNVGIGTTTNISSPLTIQANGSGNALSIIGRANGTNDEAVINFYEYGGTTRNAYIIKEAGNLGFATGTGGSASERMRIDDVGAVLIGSQPKIDTATKLQVGDNDSGVTSIWSNADDIVFEHNTNLGLTFATPNNAAATIAFADPQSVQAGWIQYLHDVDAMRFGTNGNNERMRIDSTGNVGIGTTSPVGDLNLVGGQQDIVLTNTAADGVAGLTISRIIGQARGYSNNLSVMQSIDFETNPSFWYKGDIVFKTNNTDGTDTSVAATERMRITSAGAISFGSTGTAYGTSGQILKSNGNASPTWIDGSAIPGVPGGSGTLNTIPLWTPDGDTLGDSILSQNGTSIYQGVAGTSASGYYYFNTTTTGDSGLLFADNTSTNSGFLTYNHDVDAMKFGTAGSERMRIDSNGDVGIGTTNPGAKLVVTDNNDGQDTTFKVNHTRSNSDVATQAIEVSMSLSGADTTTADRINSGILVDVVSTADGDTSNEHRLYGVYSDVTYSGMSDLVRGGYFKAESNNNIEKTAQTIGIYGQAVHDASSANGGAITLAGVYGVASLQDTGDVSNTYGGFFLADIPDTRATDVNVVKGVEGHIDINKATAINYGNMSAVSAVIDNNEGAVPNFSDQYLFKGDYQGDKGSNAYGVYCEGDKHYLQGSVGIGILNPAQPLHVSGNARVTGAYYDSNNSPGAVNQVLVSTVTGTDWVDASGSSIIGGPYLPLAGGTMTGAITMNDNVPINFGTGGSTDSRIFYDALDLNIESQGGKIFIVKDVTDLSTGIVLDSSSNVAIGAAGGASASGAKLTVTGNTYVSGTVQVPDNGKLAAGSSLDLQIFHNGSHGFVTNGTGDLNLSTTSGGLYITQFNDDGDIILQCDDGSGGVANYLTLDGDTTHAYFSNPGNVGIGTTSPGRPLTINSDTSHRAIRILENDSANESWDIGVDVDGDLNFFNSADTSPSVTFLDNGNVGIGDSNPTTNLSVVGSIGTDDIFMTSTAASSAGTAFVVNEATQLVTRTAAQVLADIGAAPATGGAYLPLAGGTMDSGAIITMSGNLNLTYAYPRINLIDTNNDSDYSIINNDGIFGIYDVTNNSYRLSISAAGNATFAGNVTVGNNGNINIPTASSGNANLNFDGSDFKITSNSSSANLKLETNSTTRLTINSSGNVGIGATSPDAQLHINNDTSNSYATLRLEGANRGGIIEMYNQTSYPVSSWTTDQSGNIFFATSGAFAATSLSTKFTILTSGNVGIGTTSPGFKFVVQDDGTDQMIADFRDSNSVYGLLLSSTGTGGKIEGRGTNHDLTINTSGTGDITLIPGGNVGIGTTAPGNKLHVHETSTVGGKWEVAKFEGDIGVGGGITLSSSSSGAEWSLIAQGASGGALANNLGFHLTDAGTSGGALGYKMTLEASSGNVGIGTTSPGYKLSVNGDIQIPQNEYIYFDNTAHYIRRGASDVELQGFNGLNLRTNGSSRLYIKQDGNVGIGVTGPSKKLHVVGDQLIFGDLLLEGSANSFRTVSMNTVDGSDNQSLYLCGGATASTGRGSYVKVEGNEVSSAGGTVKIVAGNVSTGDIDFLTANTQRMIINNAGNVGINKTSPAVKLDVSDSIAGSGFTNGLARFENTIETSTGGAGVLNIANNYQGGFGTLIKFWFEESSVATINFNSSTNAVVYNTTSDYRLKEDLQQFDGLEIVDKIKTYNYKWKKADARGYGALAHELQEVFPDAVTGEKDGEDMQGVDYSTLVPVLIKSIQELKAEIELLKQQINN